MTMIPSPYIQERSKDIRPRHVFAFLAVVLVLTVGPILWLRAHPMPNSGPASITLEDAVVNPNANTYEVYVDVSGDMPYSMAIYPAQDLGNGNYLVERSLPYSVYNAHMVKMTGSYLQDGKELVFLALSRSDVNEVLDNPGADAVDGFQVVSEGDFDGSAKVLRPNHKVTLE